MSILKTLKHRLMMPWPVKGNMTKWEVNDYLNELKKYEGDHMCNKKTKFDKFMEWVLFPVAVGNVNKEDAEAINIMQKGYVENVMGKQEPKKPEIHQHLHLHLDDENKSSEEMIQRKLEKFKNLKNNI